jgi:F420-dependent oxidoreductase-like protein
VRICLMVEGQEGVTWDDWRSLASACERHGFEALFRSDHYLSVDDRRERGSLDAWATIAALSALTSRVRLGTLVSPATFRHPSVLARNVVTADHVSGGRIELGMGAGWWEAEHTAFGFPFPPPGERMAVLEEQLEIVRRSWEQEPFSFRGEHFTLQDADPRPKPIQRPHSPLILGGAAGPRSARLAARWADEYNTVHVGTEEFARRRAAILEACERAGRDPAEMRFSLMTGFVVGADRGELQERARRLAAWRGEEGADPDAYLTELAETWVVGTVPEAIDRLRALEAAGVERVMLQHHLHEDLEVLALLGDEIIPAVA